MLKVNKARFANYLLVAFILAILLGKLLQIKALFYLAFACALTGMTIGDDNYRVGFCLMLVPNVRIFDSAFSQTFFVNILMAYPVFVKIFSSHHINITAVIHTLMLIVWELGHLLVFNYTEQLISNMACIILLYYVECVLTERESYIDFADITRKFAFGCLFSTLSFSFNFIRRYSLFDYLKTFRLKGYAGDPNYYSLYLCLAITMLLIIEGHHKKRDYIYVLMLVLIVLYTSSKMAVLTLLLILIYFLGRLLFNALSRKSKFIRRIALIAVAAAMFFSGTVVELIDKIVLRFNEKGLDTSDINSITSNRALIQGYYLDELVTNPSVLAFGYGLQYNSISQYADFGLIAHNTYLDLVMSWGVVGVAMFIVIFWQIIVKMSHVRHEKLTINHFIPMLITGFTFLALSCLSASMFWWVICASLLPLKGLNPDENAANLRNRSRLPRRKLSFRMRGIAPEADIPQL